MCELARLDDRHLKAAELTVLGRSRVSIAKELDLSLSTLHVWERAVLFQEECERLRGQAAYDTTERVRAVLQLAAPDAAATVIELASNASSEKVKASCSFGILDRTGHAPVQKQITMHMPALNRENLELAERVMKEMGVATLVPSEGREERTRESNALPQNVP